MTAFVNQALTIRDEIDALERVGRPAPVLGLDTGLRIGWALVRSGNVLAAGDYDARADWHDNPGRCLHIFGAWLAGLIREHGVCRVGIEAPPSGGVKRFGSDCNPIVAAVARMTCYGADVPVAWMAPATIRKRAFGNGKLKKAQVPAALAARGIAGWNDHARAAIATCRALGKDADALLARVREVRR